jgi:hypothetical protein
MIEVTVGAVWPGNETIIIGFLVVFFTHPEMFTIIGWEYPGFTSG